MSNEIVTWQGVKIEELTHEQLLEAFKFLGRMYKDAIDAHQATLHMWKTCREARSIF